MSRNQIKNLIVMLDEAYAGPAWHGPCLRGALRDVTAREAAWRPAQGRHNIWELAVHAAYWKYAAKRRILGEVGHEFGEAGHNWFLRPVETSGGASEKQWRKDLVHLARIHKELRDAAFTLTDSALNRRTRGSKYTNRSIIAGAAMHDVYHAGQIQLLKRLRRR